jgi:hypothetical protein
VAGDRWRAQVTPSTSGDALHPTASLDQLLAWELPTGPCRKRRPVPATEDWYPITAARPRTLRGEVLYRAMLKVHAGRAVRKVLGIIELAEFAVLLWGGAGRRWAFLQGIGRYGRTVAGHGRAVAAVGPYRFWRAPR